jgi:hypothetical protein
MATTTTPHLIAYRIPANGNIAPMAFNATVPYIVFNDIWVVSGSEAYAVGEDGYTIQWDGTEWSRLYDSASAPTAIDLKSIWMSIAPTKTLVAAGFSLAGPANLPSPVVIRGIYAAPNWSWENLGFTASTAQAVTSVVAFGDEVWVGSADYGLTPPCEGGLFTMDLNGSWSAAPTSERARQLWAGTNHVHGASWCIGSTGSQLTRFNSSSSLADSTPVTGVITSIWGVSECELYAVGLGGVILKR